MTSRLFKHELIICLATSKIQSVLLFLLEAILAFQYLEDSFSIVKKLTFVACLFACQSVILNFELSKLEFVIDFELFGLPNWVHYTRTRDGYLSHILPRVV